MEILPLGLAVPEPSGRGNTRYYQCHVRDGSYAIGEALLDSVSILWFDSTEALETALKSQANECSAQDLPNFIEMKYAYTFVAQEHWIIGPEPRA